MIGGGLQQISGELAGQLHGNDAKFVGVSIDSRALSSGELFVAIRGERFDGHDFVADVAGGGAAGALVHQLQEAALPQVCVGDTRLALGQLAAAWRQEFDIPVIAVTGSNGKTTVKEMLASIMGRRGPVLSTRGNLNNDIGLPLTLMRLEKEHRCAVVEMGANQPGEIAGLTALACPTVGVVNNAGSAHLEGFGSPDGVARAKGELFAGLPADGVAVINSDQDHVGLWKQLAGTREIISFGLGRDARFTANDVSQGVRKGKPWLSFFMVTPLGSFPVELNFAGTHNVMNALAAAAAASAAGAGIDDIRDGLQATRQMAGRLQLLSRKGGGWLIDDTYNANPVSARAAMEFAASLGGQHWLVLGDMGELGPDAEIMHRELGLAAGELGFERIYSCGELAARAAEAFPGESQCFDGLDALIDALNKDFAVARANGSGDSNKQVIPLLKASRSMRFDKVVDALCITATEIGESQGE
ncbi:MAG: UDP-N-acetylmuramoyl-tripeptide--D-alanyl-D-alanine ligase [Gammaproteobacteria bacterium]|nr:UDP-N-acetylmuramoyl-tripeptide--D-alanyl-D-alanine ligase [Gammaproteobacteria bacterium]